jgi:hypothetical protein
MLCAPLALSSYVVASSRTVFRSRPRPTPHKYIIVRTTIRKRREDGPCALGYHVLASRILAIYILGKCLQIHEMACFFACISELSTACVCASDSSVFVVRFGLQRWGCASRYIGDGAALQSRSHTRIMPVSESGRDSSQRGGCASRYIGDGAALRTRLHTRIMLASEPCGTLDCVVWGTEILEERI